MTTMTGRLIAVLLLTATAACRGAAPGSAELRALPGFAEFPSQNPNRGPAHVMVPDSYDPARSYPVVVMLHGYTSDATQEGLYLGLGFRVNTDGFILVAPEGTKDSKGQQFWSATDFCCDFEHSGVDDAGYLKGLISEVEAKYSVDAKRIYAFGHSNGGFMANRLACEADSPLAGFVSLAGSTFLQPEACHASKPMSALQIQAVDDPTVAYNGQPQYYPGATTTQKRWAEHDGCDPEPTAGPAMNLILSLYGDDTTPSAWQHCKDGTKVSLWTIRAATPAEQPYHNAHIPLLGADFTDRALAFLLQ